MNTQRCDVVKCSVCKEIKFGGTVIHENLYDEGIAICDDCNKE